MTTACATGNSEPPLVPSGQTFPDLFEYAADVQALALAELDAIGKPPCHRREIFEGCSALRLFVNDYHTVRNQIRAGGAAAEGD